LEPGHHEDSFNPRGDENAFITLRPLPGRKTPSLHYLPIHQPITMPCIGRSEVTFRSSEVTHRPKRSPNRRSVGRFRRSGSHFTYHRKSLSTRRKPVSVREKSLTAPRNSLLTSRKSLSIPRKSVAARRKSLSAPRKEVPMTANSVPTTEKSVNNDSQPGRRSLPSRSRRVTTHAGRLPSPTRRPAIHPRPLPTSAKSKPTWSRSIRPPVVRTGERSAAPAVPHDRFRESLNRLLHSAQTQEEPRRQPL
jgi:hypothetical protein